MRRLTSVFVSWRDKSSPPPPDSIHDSSPPKKPRAFASLARRVTQASLPPLLPRDLTNSSSSSSSGSTVILRTPDDEPPPHRPSDSKQDSWQSWLGNSKLADLAADEAHQTWFSHPTNPPLSCPSADPANETDDAGTNPSDDDSDQSEGISLPYHTSSPSQILRAKENARIVITNSLIRHTLTHPLLHVPDSIVFPRSCNPSKTLPRTETLQSKMHKKSLLSRLDNLSPFEELSIQVWGSKPTLTSQKASLDSVHDTFPDIKAIVPHSTGLCTWVSRPYYEERVQVWTRQDSGQVIRSRVIGPQLGVAALEYSETLDLLAGMIPEAKLVDDMQTGPTFDPIRELLPLSSSTSGDDASTLDVRPVEPTSLSEASSLQAPPSQPPLGPALPELSLPEPRNAQVPKPVPPKRGVRFADDDSKDDQIPLGHVLRIRKNKERKAMFLRQERERRAKAQADLALQGDERVRKEAGRIEMEKLRPAREQEKKRAEEQDKQRGYLEELQAARARRELARTRPTPPSASHIRSPERDRPESREPTRASPRRGALSHGSSLATSTTGIASHDAPSTRSLPHTFGRQNSLRRPPSVHPMPVASTEDVRNREHRRLSRRISMVADPINQAPQYNPRSSFAPSGLSWPSVPPVPSVPPLHLIPTVPLVNAVPFYPIQMPLLPSPFMMGLPLPDSAVRLQSQDSSRQSFNQLPRINGSDMVMSARRNPAPRSYSAQHSRHSVDEAMLPASNSVGNRAFHSYHSSLRPGSRRVSSHQHSNPAVDTHAFRPVESSSRRVSVTQPHSSLSHRRTGVS